MTASASDAPAAGRLAPGGRILVVKLSSLGDLFHVLPAAHALATGAGVRLDWVTQPEYADLVRCFPDIDRVIPFPRTSFSRGFGPFLRELRRTRYDWILDFQGLLKSALVARLARGRIRVGPSFHREGSRWLYSAVAGPRDKCRHAVEENLDMARFFGLPAAEPVFPVRFPAAPRREPAPRIAVLPVSRWPTKNWPVASFARAARGLQETYGATIFLIGGADNRDAAASIESQLQAPAVNCAGRLSLVETGSLLAEMQLLISNDSGPMHMAAALGVPVLAVFGPTDPVRTGPFGAGHRVLRADLPCMPCFDRQCRLGDVRCMAGVAPEAVIQAAKEMLAGAARDTDRFPRVRGEGR